MSRIISRLARIEEQLKPASKGSLFFQTEDEETYYKDAFANPDPKMAYSKEDLEALEHDGWQLIIVLCPLHYASIPVGQQDSLTG